VRPIAFASLKLLPRESRYSTIERECLAITWAVKKFQEYLYGTEFILETDHQPLQYLRQAKFQNGRLMRWALALQPYRFLPRTIRGRDNVGSPLNSLFSGVLITSMEARRIGAIYFWHAFASRGFVSDSWAFLFILELLVSFEGNHRSVYYYTSMRESDASWSYRIRNQKCEEAVFDLPLTRPSKTCFGVNVLFLSQILTLFL